MCRLVGRIVVPVVGKDDLDPANDEQECLGLSPEQCAALRNHCLELSKGGVSAPGTLTTVTQWFNELYCQAGSSSAISSAEGLALLSPGLFRPPAAWEWLVVGTHPAAACSLAPASARASWVSRSHQTSFGQLLSVVAKQREDSETLREKLLRAVEQDSAHAGEARALRTRLSELERLLKGGLGSQGDTQPGSGCDEEGTVAKLKKENQVKALSVFASILCVLIV